MTEGKEHKAMKKCAEKVVNGRADVKAQGFCVEIETSSRTDRIKHAIDKLSSSRCGGGFVVVPQAAMKKTRAAGSSGIPDGPAGSGETEGPGQGRSVMEIPSAWRVGSSGIRLTVVSFCGQNPPVAGGEAALVSTGKLITATIRHAGI